MIERRDCGRFAFTMSKSCITLTLLYGSAAMGAAAPKDACALLSQSQASAALGIKVDSGHRPVPDDARICDWRQKGKPEGRAPHVMVYLIDADEFEIGKKPSLVPKIPQSGIGDEAYFARPMKLSYTLSVKKGNVYFRVMASTSVPGVNDQQSTDAKDQSADKELAAAILKKL